MTVYICVECGNSHIPGCNDDTRVTCRNRPMKIAAAPSSRPEPPAAETVFSDDGTIEWRIPSHPDSVSDALVSLEMRQPKAPLAWMREWRPTFGDGAVAVTPDRIRAWSRLTAMWERPPSEALVRSAVRTKEWEQDDADRVTDAANHMRQVGFAQSANALEKIAERMVMLAAAPPAPEGQP